VPLSNISPEQSQVVLAVWMFALGSAVGSFLNVVVYRLPAGLSLVHPGSRCPACQHPIRWFDNVPVFGWVMLRGCCRDCKARISPRYPIVETVTALLFVLLLLTEGISSADNLPRQPIQAPSGTVASPLGTGEAAALVAYHLLLTCTMLCAVLIEYDGNRLPVTLLAPALIVGVVAPVVVPELRPVSAGAVTQGWLGALVDGAAGLAAGLVFGALMRPALGAKWKTGFLLTLATVGLFLGWQACVALGFTAVAVHLLVRAASAIFPWLQRVPPTTWLATATFVWIINWKTIVRAWPALA
jgi:leader peptidase (prepilin peptidase)/N-methyltransferase